MTAPVLRLTDAVDDVRYETVRSTLERVLEHMDDDPEFKPTGAVVILLDETGGAYTHRMYHSSLKTTEVAALLEIAKLHKLRSI